MNKDLRLKRVEFTGVNEDKEVVMDNDCLKVMVKNFTDNDIYVGIGGVDEVTLDNAVMIKSNYYQILFINENKDCYYAFDTLTVNGMGTGTVECIQILY